MKRKIKLRVLNSKGFSLLELIIVITIMAVLVGIVAPMYMKYVESSRCSDDIQTAVEIQLALLADVAEGRIDQDVDGVAFLGGDATEDTVHDNPGQYSTHVIQTPYLQGGTVARYGKFYIVLHRNDGVCNVYADPACTTYCLTTQDGANAYKLGE